MLCDECDDANILFFFLNMSCDESSFGKYPWEEMGKAKYIKGYISKIYRALNIDADSVIPIITKYKHEDY